MGVGDKTTPPQGDPGAAAVNNLGAAGNTGNGATTADAQASSSTKVEGTKEAKAVVNTNPSATQPK